MCVGIFLVKFWQKPARFGVKGYLWLIHIDFSRNFEYLFVFGSYDVWVSMVAFSEQKYVF